MFYMHSVTITALPAECAAIASASTCARPVSDFTSSETGKTLDHFQDKIPGLKKFYFSASECKWYKTNKQKVMKYNLMSQDFIDGYEHWLFGEYLDSLGFQMF